MAPSPNPRGKHELSPAPLACFITFRTYGTWLHGDVRGSMDREHRGYETHLLEPNPTREAWERSQMQQPPLILGARERVAISEAIETVSNHRGWALHAVNVRPNHVHVVVGGGDGPEAVMGALKSWSTRILRERGLVAHERRVWARHGSTRYLWTEADIDAASAYVLEGQDRFAPTEE